MKLTGMLLLCIFTFLMTSCSGENPSTSSEVPLLSSEQILVSSFISSSELEPSSIPSELEQSSTPQEVLSSEPGLPSSHSSVPTSTEIKAQDPIEETNNSIINIQIGDQLFTAKLADTVSAKAFSELLAKGSFTIEMSDYSGFEKVGSIGQTLPNQDRQQQANAGDIMLYNQNQIVVFYRSNSWSYTKIATVENLSGWENALGKDNVTITFFK